MRKGLPQVAKNAVAKKGPQVDPFWPRQGHFWGQLGLLHPGAFLRTFYRFFCIFM